MEQFPLTRSNRLRLAHAFSFVPRVDLSIECVLENQMGKAYVDRQDEPTVYQIVLAVFHYLAGDPSTSSAQELMQNIPPYNLVMSTAPGFKGLFEQVHGRSIRKMTRYQFSSEHLNQDYLLDLLEKTKLREQVLPFDLALASKLYADPDGYVDLSTYDSPEDFLVRGIGYTCNIGGIMVGAAYASLVCSSGIEISLFVEPVYRRQGVATALSTSLLLWCLERNMEPHWDAANLESVGLAEKLGYKSMGTYTAIYRTDD